MERPLKKDKVVTDFVNQALQNRYWIYNSHSKTWYSPEEFLSKFEGGILTLTVDWMERYKIMNPLKGVAAADVIVNEIQKKRSDFVNRVTEYYSNKL